MALWVESMISWDFLTMADRSGGATLGIRSRSLTSAAPALPKETARYLLPSRPSVSIAATESAFTRLAVARSRESVTSTWSVGRTGSRISSTVPLRTPPRRTSAPGMSPATLGNSARSR